MEHEDYEALESAFIDGFRGAGDKQGFLRLAHIPLELHQPDRPGLKLMQVLVEEVFEVGRASPGFGSRELVYHPLPGPLVTARAKLRFRYVSAEDLSELSLAEVLARSEKAAPEAAMHDHGDHHHRRHSHAKSQPRSRIAGEGS